MKLPLIVTDYYAYNSVPSLEGIKLMTIIMKMGQNGRIGQNVQLYISICVIGTL